MKIIFIIALALMVDGLQAFKQSDELKTPSKQSDHAKLNSRLHNRLKHN